MPAREDYGSLTPERQAKVLALFKRLAEAGSIVNRQQFHKLGPKGGKSGSELREFKRFQDRFLGDFRPGGRFLISAYEHKKSDRLDSAVVARAVRILAENDLYEVQHGR
jgi:hypothetical protein